MNDMIGLFAAMYKDVYGLSGAHTSGKDIAYLTRRVETEGKSFLTITLPTFADALLQGLESGMFPHSMVSGFARHRGKSLPKFLQGLTRKVFDYESGVLLSDPCVNSIYGIRQLCSALKKVELPCTKERVKHAYQRYLDTDSEVVPLRSIAKVDQENLKRTFNALFRDANLRTEREIYERNLHPRYSGGAVAEKLNENDKFSAPWFRRLDPLLPPDEFLVPSLGHQGYLDGKVMVPVGRELPARVVHVPKTLKTPRLISVEPTCIQFAQQALMESIYRNTALTRVGQLSMNLRDQTINAKLALEGSEDGSIATIDLSEASDRVSAGLVSHLFKDTPLLREALFRARSSRVSHPLVSGDYRLRKFASMGSATCFPVEAMVFLSIATLTVAMVDRQGLSDHVVRRCSRRVTVFGDDITVPKRYAPYVMLALEYFGLKVNRDKSFHQGLFRESCGTDAYAGNIVTPVYVRTLFPHDKEDAGEAVSSISTANQLFAAGLWNASEFVRKKVERALKVRLPIVLANSPALGLHIPWRSYYDQRRYNDQLHRPEVRSFGVVTEDVSSELGDVEALTKALLRLQGRKWSGPQDFSSSPASDSKPKGEPSNAGCEHLEPGKSAPRCSDGCNTFDTVASYHDVLERLQARFSRNRENLLGPGQGKVDNSPNGQLANYAGRLRGMVATNPNLSAYTKRHVFRLKRGWYVPF